MIFKHWRARSSVFVTSTPAPLPSQRLFPSVAQKSDRSERFFERFRDLLRITTRPRDPLVLLTRCPCRPVMGAAGFKITQMRILLRNNETDLFFVDSGLWTANQAHAMDFDSGDHAIRVAQVLRLTHSSTVYAFEIASMDFSIEISPRMVPHSEGDRVSLVTQSP
jgi:hypothetical protein